MDMMTRDEFEALLWRMYRRGLIHGGLVAVATAAAWLVM